MMNTEKMRAVAEKAYREWMKENGSPEAISAWLVRNLQNEREKLVLEACGAEKDAFGRGWILRGYGNTPILEALAARAKFEAPKWAADAFAGGLPAMSPATLKALNRAYLRALAEEVEKLARARAIKDAAGILNGVLNQGDAANGA